uniref:Nuclear transcription factor Y subunit gamma n=1 Tax=Anopheles farauti TaxID=69004 RepID=A0A182QFH2_9DIPT
METPEVEDTASRSPPLKNLLPKASEPPRTTGDDHDGKKNKKRKITEIEKFWPAKMNEVRSMESFTRGMQNMPLSRIKRIMKLDENVSKISDDAVIVLEKATDFFIQELTHQGWIHTKQMKRRTLKRSDVTMAASPNEQFDFLIDIIDTSLPTTKSSYFAYAITPSKSSSTTSSSCRPEFSRNFNFSKPSQCSPRTLPNPSRYGATSFMIHPFCVVICVGPFG